jgi:hypothetical protein
MVIEIEAGVDLQSKVSSRAEAPTMCPESLTMIKDTEALELHLLPQVMLQLILTQF